MSLTQKTVPLYCAHQWKETATGENQVGELDQLRFRAGVRRAFQCLPEQ